MTTPTYSLWKDLDRIAVDIVRFNARDYCGGLAIYTDSQDLKAPDVVYAPGTWTHLLKEEA
jgi:hypothetical protein